MTLRYGAVSFTLPRGFTDETLVTLNGPESDIGIQTNIVIRTEPIDEAIDIGVFVALQEQMVTQMFQGARVERGEATRIGGRDFVIRDYAFSSAGERVRQLQAYFVLPTRAFVLCATANDTPDFSALRETVLRLLASVAVDP